MENCRPVTLLARKAAGATKRDCGREAYRQGSLAAGREPHSARRYQLYMFRPCRQASLPTGFLAVDSTAPFYTRTLSIPPLFAAFTYFGSQSSPRTWRAISTTM